MKVENLYITVLILWVLLSASCRETVRSRQVIDFNDQWEFFLSEDLSAEDTVWRTLRLPHDWSIEGTFSADHPAGAGGGALPGGTGWYRKNFTLGDESEDRKVFIEFDGVYQNSTVWVNGQEVGNRPNGYISFAYDITPFVYFGKKENVILVKVKNTPQPNSRWYSGSGIYRNVRLVLVDEVHIPQWGTYINSEVAENTASIQKEIKINNSSSTDQNVLVTTTIFDQNGNQVAVQESDHLVATGTEITARHQLRITNPYLWSMDNPHLYQAHTRLSVNQQQVDSYTTPFGIRTFRFDVEKGFFLNDEAIKIKGVCLHHDLGALGAAFNTLAMERQLEIMQGMGVNAIRTAHNPPAPEVLDLCDRMGILVMDEIFDMWAKGKNEHDYSMYWDEWHAQDLTDFILRDRNHPSVIMWSVGNEIMEQYDHSDSSGGIIASRLASIVRSLDDRPILTANNDISPDNPLLKYGGLDMVGYNYHHEAYLDVPKDHPGKPFIATETHSSLATRGHYDMPSDSVRVWPIAWDKPFTQGNPDQTVSAYDHVRTPWGSTQEDTWRIVKNNDFISGLFIWTGFDYLGEPTPYSWPSRSSYFGIVDLAGFPKDTYFMYQSEWTNDTVLHVFPHWNWEQGQEIDLWAYYNHADEAELYLNGQSQGVRKKGSDDFHVMWRLTFAPGDVKVVSRKEGSIVSSKTITTAGKPHRLELTADRDILHADGADLAFVTIKVLDERGVPVPTANNQIRVKVEGKGTLAGVDNGDPTSHASFREDHIQAFNGLALAIIQTTFSQGDITVSAVADGMESDQISIQTIQVNNQN